MYTKTQCASKVRIGDAHRGVEMGREAEGDLRIGEIYKCGPIYISEVPKAILEDGATVTSEQQKGGLP